MGNVNETTLKIVAMYSKQIGKKVKPNRKKVISTTQQLKTEQTTIIDNNSYNNVFTKELFEFLLQKFKSKKEIAKALKVTTRTINNYLKKFGLYKPEITPANSIAIDAEKLQQLSEQNLSLNTIASRLGLRLSALRSKQNKLNIITDSQNEFRMLQDYFKAKTPADKAKAFEVIDKQLIEIAKNEYKPDRCLTFEDYLQDVRLRFFEYIDKCEKKGIKFPYKILTVVKETAPSNTNRIKTTSNPKTIENIKNNYGLTDIETNQFEQDDFDKKLWIYLIGKIRDKQRFIFEEHLFKGEKISDLAYDLGHNNYTIKKYIMDTITMFKDILSTYNRNNVLKRIGFLQRVKGIIHPTESQILK